MPLSPAFRFDGANQTAQRAAARRAARLVTRISTETRDAIRTAIVRSLREGIPPYDAARVIRNMVGMNAQQAQAAMNYRQGLIDLGVDIQKVGVLTDRYIAKKIRERSVTIARTEIMDSLNEGVRESYRQAKAEGLLGDDAQKEWITTPDEITCQTCGPMDGVKVDLDEDFETPDGPMSGPIAHPNCRCSVVPVP